MENLMTYLRWRQDIPMSVSPLNEVDNLNLSQLAYGMWFDCIPSTFDEVVSLHDAAEMFFDRGYDEIMLKEGYFSCAQYVPMLRIMKDSVRYKDFGLCAYRWIHDNDQQEQFGAVTVLLNARQACVSFCGTDSTLVGWKEDFNMSFMTVVPSQTRAADYLVEAMIHLPDHEYILTGHSKGGNLAVFAAVYLPEEKQKQIKRIYNNDGPGFSKEIVESEYYRRIQDRIMTFVPQSSIIGMIMEHEEDYTVVSSSQRSILQHDPFTWKVNVNDFVEVQKVNTSSRILDKAMKEWLKSLSVEQKSAFVDGVYKCFTDTGLTSAKQFGFGSMFNVLRNYMTSDDENKRVIADGLRVLLRSIYDTSMELAKKSREKEKEIKDTSENTQ